MDLSNKLDIEDVIYISAKNKEGLDALAEKIYEVTNLSDFDPKTTDYLNNARQISLMEKANNALKNAKNAIEKLSYKLENVINFKLPIEDSERNLVVLKKINHTKSIYPRPYSKIKVKSL